MIENQLLYSQICWTLQQILNTHYAACLSTSQNTPLFIQPAQPADIATLPLACEMAGKYLHLADGQVALLNDPFSGGTELSDVTLIMGVSPFKGLDLKLATRLGLRPKLDFTEQMTQHHLRIPPTPLVNVPGVQTEDILKAISEHPQAPDSFIEKVKSEILKLEVSRAQIISAFQSLLGSAPKKAFWDGYFSFSEKRHSHALDELPFGQTQVILPLEGNGQIQLTVNVGQTLKFDFSGTQLPAKYRVTYPVTFGYCLSAVNSFLSTDLPLTAGQFRNVEVYTPAQSPLNAQFPSNVSSGHFVIGPLIGNAVLMALSQLCPQQATAGFSAPVLAEFIFSSGQTFFERIPGGAAALAKKNGDQAVDPWLRRTLKPSIEEIENRFPLQVLRNERREGSGGRGQASGGDGVRRVFKLKEDAKLKWLFEQFKSKTEGYAGGSAGDPPLIKVQRLKAGTLQDAEDLSTNGEVELHAGDIVTFLSAGGGGFGKAN